MDGSPEKNPLVEALERFWTQALTAMTQAEDEASKAVSKFAASAGAGGDEVRRQAKDLSARLVSQRQQLERRVEDAVARSLARFQVPRREQLVALNQRLDSLQRRVEALRK